MEVREVCRLLHQFSQSKEIAQSTLVLVSDFFSRTLNAAYKVEVSPIQCYQLPAEKAFFLHQHISSCVVVLSVNSPLIY